MNNIKICDLHTHSTFSDGTLTPYELIEAALAEGLSAVALTDHNTVDGLEAFMAAAEGRSIEAIPGIEFSVSYGKKELHLLGLFIEPAFFGEISQVTEKFHRYKKESNLLLLENLRKIGMEVDFNEVASRTEKGNFNRSHVADILVEKGYVSSKDDAFGGVLHKNGGYYFPPLQVDFFEAMKLIRKAGGVPVLAHPFLQLSESELRELLPRAISCGLAGMEAAYSTYDEETTALAEKIAEEFSIAKSGGSDFHGSGKKDIFLAKGKGNLAVPLEWAEKLKKMK